MVRSRLCVVVLRRVWIQCRKKNACNELYNELFFECTVSLMPMRIKSPAPTTETIVKIHSNDVPLYFHGKYI